jgi:hypothetical protein
LYRPGVLFCRIEHKVRLLHLTLVVTTIAVGAAGCAKAKANTLPVMPVLEPPPPPPRVVEDYIDEPLPTVEPSPVETALINPPPPPPTRSSSPRNEPPKPDPSRAEADRPAANPPTLTLKPAPGVAAKTEASIRELLGRAQRDLQRVNYAALDADGRVQFDIARRFMEQAEEALKGGNLAYAGKLADKAATMGAVLVR